MLGETGELCCDPLRIARSAGKDHRQDAERDVEEEREAGDPCVRRTGHGCLRDVDVSVSPDQGEPTSYARANPEVSTRRPGRRAPAGRTPFPSPLFRVALSCRYLAIWLTRAPPGRGPY